MVDPADPLLAHDARSSGWPRGRRGWCPVSRVASMFAPASVGRHFRPALSEMAIMRTSGGGCLRAPLACDVSRPIRTPRDRFVAADWALNRAADEAAHAAAVALCRQPAREQRGDRGRRPAPASIMPRLKSRRWRLRVGAAPRALPAHGPVRPQFGRRHCCHCRGAACATHGRSSHMCCETSDTGNLRTMGLYAARSFFANVLGPQGRSSRMRAMTTLSVEKLSS